MAKFEWLECPACEFGTESSARYKAHVRSVHGKIRDFECDECGHKTDHSEKLIKHIKNVHEEKQPKIKLNCDLCDYSTAHKQALSYHIKVVHLHPSKYQCDHCEYRAGDKNRLLRHKKARHDKIKDHKCDECPYASSYSQNLKKHMEQVHGKDSEQRRVKTQRIDEEDIGAFIDKIGTLLCNFCDFETPRVHILGIHVDNSHLTYEDIPATIQCEKPSEKARKSFSCELCNFSASRKRGLSKHMKLVHLKKSLKYNCDGCKYASNKKLYMRRHKKRVHDKVKAEQCGERNFASSYSLNVKQHEIQVHDKGSQALKVDLTKTVQPGECSKYSCGVCEYKTINKHRLLRHMKAIHDKVKDHKCEECSFASSYSSSLKEHIINIHSKGGQARKIDLTQTVKSFKCDNCEYSATNKHYIARHKKAVHDKIKDHKCEQCDYASSYSHDLKHHMRQHQERRKPNLTPPIIRSKVTQ